MTNAISTGPDTHNTNPDPEPADDGPGLTAEQYAQLTQPLHRSRVGTNAGGYSHVEAWDVRRTLIRIFGYGGFDVETITCDLVSQIEMPPGTVTFSSGAKNEKTCWTVVYRAQIRLIIKDRKGRELAHFDDGAVGDSINQPTLGGAHDNAMKTALSQALKRCAVNGGDQFGLSLYNGGGGRPDPNGYLRPVVLRSLIAPFAHLLGADEPSPPVIDQAADEPVLPEPGASPPPAPVSTPTAGPADDEEPPPDTDPQAYSPAIGAGRGDTDQDADPAPPERARASTREVARNGSPAEAAPVTSKRATGSGEALFDTGVRAIVTAKSLAQLDQLVAVVATLVGNDQITPGQAGRLRLKLGARRDEIAAQTPPPAGPPKLADDTDGAVIGAPA